MSATFSFYKYKRVKDKTGDGFKKLGSFDSEGKAVFNFGMYQIPSLVFYPSGSVDREAFFQFVSGYSETNSQPEFGTTDIIFLFSIYADSAFKVGSAIISSTKDEKKGVKLSSQKSVRNVIDADFVYVGMEESLNAEIGFRFVEAGAYSLLRDHTLFVHSVGLIKDSSIGLTTYNKFRMADMFSSMTNNILFDRARIIQDDKVELDTDHRQVDTHKSSLDHVLYFSGYYKPVSLSKFMAIILEARRYGYAVSYQPEFGFYILRDLVVGYGIDTLDYYITNELLKYGTVENVKEHISAFNVSKGRCTTISNPTSFYPPGAERGYIRDYTAEVLGDKQLMMSDQFVTRYSKLPGMRYDIQEYAPIYSGYGIPSIAERRFVADIQMLHMQRNIRTASIEINGGDKILQCAQDGIFSRLIGFIGHESLCMTRGLNPTYSPPELNKKLVKEKEDEFKNKSPQNDMAGSPRAVEAARIIDKKAFRTQINDRLYAGADPKNFSIDSSKFDNFYNELYETKLKTEPDILTNISIVFNGTASASVQLVFAERVGTKFSKYGKEWL